jgi:hypothetical protein
MNNITNTCSNRVNMFTLKNCNNLENNNLDRIKLIINEKNLSNYNIDLLILHAFKVSDNTILKYLIDINILDKIKDKELMDTMYKRSDIRCDIMHEYITNHYIKKMSLTMEIYNDLLKNNIEYYKKWEKIEKEENQSKINILKEQINKLLQDEYNTKDINSELRYQINELRVKNSALLKNAIESDEAFGNLLKKRKRN